jgi:hypothetical protein
MASRLDEVYLVKHYFVRAVKTVQRPVASWLKPSQLVRTWPVGEKTRPVGQVLWPVGSDFRVQNDKVPGNGVSGPEVSYRTLV